MRAYNHIRGSKAERKMTLVFSLQAEVMERMRLISIGYVVKVKSTCKLDIYENRSKEKALADIVHLAFDKVPSMKTLLKNEDPYDFDGDFSVDTIGFNFTREEFIATAYAELFLNREERDELIGRIISPELRRQLDEIVASTAWHNPMRRVIGEDYIIVSSLLGDDVSRKFIRNRNDGSIKLEIVITGVLTISYFVDPDEKSIRVIVHHHVLKRTFTIDNKLLNEDNEPLGDDEATELFGLMQATFYRWVVKVDFDNVYSRIPTVEINVKNGSSTVVRVQAPVSRAARNRSPPRPRDEEGGMGGHSATDW